MSSISIIFYFIYLIGSKARASMRAAEVLPSVEFFLKYSLTLIQEHNITFFAGLGICSFAHSGSDRSGQMSHCERIAQVAHDKKRAICSIFF